MHLVEGFVPPKKEDTEKYLRLGWWRGVTLGDILDKAAAQFPDKEALVEDRTRLTYAQLKEAVDKLAISLSRLGIGDGDCVLLQLPNWAEFFYAFYALQRLGAPAVLLLPRHMQLEINHFCQLTKAKTWILPETYRKTDFRPIIDDVRKANPHLKHIITVRGSRNSSFINFESLISDVTLTKRDLDDYIKLKPEAAQISFILPTGGTTGLPKAVPRTHNSAVCEAEWKAIAREQSVNEICLLSTPLEHNLALAAMNSIVFGGGKVVLLDSTLSEDFCKTVQQEKITCAPLVPTLLSRLIEFENLDKYDLSPLRALYVGGAKTPPEVIKAVRQKLGRIYISAFGMSEGATCTTRLDDKDEIILNSVGKTCCPYDEFKVVDENGRDLLRNTEGELLAKGPGVFSGYLKSPEENRLAFTSDGFFITGDLAVIDDTGIVTITGRKKDLIIRGGENISPSEIESLMLRHPDIEDVAVIGMPDKEMGERACAYVKSKNNAQPTLAEIITFLKTQGASVIQLPERLELIDTIPLTNIGKADKKALKEDLKKRLEDSNA